MRCWLLAALAASAASSAAVDYSLNKDAASLIASEPQVPGAEVFSFAKAVASGMVLAASPKRAMLWGFCPEGAKVDVVFGGATLAATIGPDQAGGSLTTWRVLLPATAAGFAEHNISASSGGQTLTLSGVLFGEVWVCSGQSNMAYPIGTPTCWNASNVNCTDTNRSHDRSQCSYGCVQDAGEEIGRMAGYDGGMRLFQVGGNSQPSPQPEMAASSGWLEPSAMGGKFSAACWFFGREVYDALAPKRPVGLIETNVGGTPDEHWSSPDALHRCVGSEPWQFPANFTDSVLWNGMVVPLLRTVHSGVVWYQGENNAPEPRRYNCSFPSLIQDWRRKWSLNTDGATDADFPFGWAQLNSFDFPKDQCAAPKLRDAPEISWRCAGDVPEMCSHTGRAPLLRYNNRVFNPPNPPSDCGTGCAPQCSTACLGPYHEWGDYSQGFTGIRYAEITVDIVSRRSWLTTAGAFRIGTRSPTRCRCRRPSRPSSSTRPSPRDRFIRRTSSRSASGWPAAASRSRTA